MAQSLVTRPLGSSFLCPYIAAFNTLADLIIYPCKFNGLYLPEFYT
ncbi:hypothetical protein VCHA52P453_240060 [Vibrio chagasii]|nr:hypothetical protein VCHA39P226_230002 [Vibrio chagasii]CAH7180966.1 hypothetical protein VCHA52P453_240060 [Vibrio chagasii]